MNIMLKNIFLWSVVATCQATSNRNGVTPPYMKLNLHCSATNAYDGDTPQNGECVLDVNSPTDNSANEAATIAELVAGYGKSRVFAQFLVTLPDLDGGATGLDGHAAGSCLNYKVGTANMLYTANGTSAMDKSVRFFYNDNDDTDSALAYVYAGVNCSGAGADSTSGFIWGDKNINGKFANGGVGNFDAAAKYGLRLNAALTDVVEATAVRWLGKKSFSGQLIGPYTNNSCRGLSYEATTSWFLPFVVALEDATGETNYDAYTETAVSSTHKCRSARGDKNGATANDAIWYSWKLGSSATNGDITFIVSQGTGAKLVGVAAPAADDGTNAAKTNAECVAGNTHHEATFNMTWDGTFTNCVQAKDAAGETIPSKFYKLVPSIFSTGSSWPSTVAAPSACAACANASPASGLHISAFTAVLLAVLALIA